ncbi:uncharacterized protein LOC141537352 [Cotesia typhae]|uniref:uncharacterized protein LOC141537352 n=1 Tax=Cotesia typhae TaxID=2053667 RepID=UPI003D699CD0
MPPIQAAGVLDDADVAEIVFRKTGSWLESPTWILEKISTTNGFMGTYYRLSVTWTTNLSFFVKTLPPEGPQREFIRQNKIFSKEIIMYDEILPKIGNTEPSKWAPDCYLLKQNVIVMEDLTCQAFSTLNKHLDFDFPTFECLFNCFAKLHSRSLIFGEQRKVSLLESWTEPLKENLFRESGRSMMYQVSALKGICCLIDLVLPPEARQKTKDKVLHWAGGILKALEPSKKHRNVICHRDVWSANFMFKKLEDKLVDCRLIDFQYYSYVNPAIDLVVAMYLNTSRVIRDKHFDQLVKGYYKDIGKFLKEEGLDVDDVLPWDSFRASCIEARPWGMMYNLFGLQMTLLDDQACKQLAESSEFMEDVIYGEKRDQFVSIQFQRNKLFRDKFTENIWEIFECLPEQIPL